MGNLCHGLLYVLKSFPLCIYKLELRLITSLQPPAKRDPTPQTVLGLVFKINVSWRSFDTILFCFCFFSNGYIVLHKMNMPHPFLSQGVVRGAHPCPLYGFYFWKADNIAINIYPPILVGGGECVPNIFTNKITRSNGMHFSFCLMLSKKLLPNKIV